MGQGWGLTQAASKASNAMANLVLDRDNTTGDGHENCTTFLDALPFPSAVLNREGVVTQVNSAWRGFACANDMSDPTFGLGQCYIDIARGATGAWHEGGAAVAAGLSEVLTGERASFAYTYPCPNASGETWFKLVVGVLKSGDTIVGAVVQHIDVTRQDAAELKRLTPRERDVLIGVVEGLSNKAIARRDNVSESAIKLHLRNIFPKLGVTNRTQAALVGERLLMVGTDPMAETLTPEPA